MSIYYISAAGNNSNDGLSESTPWQTVGRIITQLSIAGGIPGDKFLLRGGDAFNTAERLGVFSQINSDAEPITVGSYGIGRATINITADVEGLVIFDCNVICENLIFTRSGSSTKQGIVLFGFESAASVQFTKTVIRNCRISGFDRGILILSYQVSGLYRSVKVQNNHILNCYKSGIESLVDRSVDSRFLSAVVERNKVELITGVVGAPSDENHGNNIVLGQVENSRIEGNICRGSAGAARNHNAIWYWGSRNSIIRRNVASGMQGTGTDRGGIGIDIDCSDITVESNYVFNCQGQGILIMNALRSIVRHNVIVNCCTDLDTAGAILHFGSNAASTAVSLTSDATIYNNLVIMPPGRTNPALSADKTGDTTRVFNNILVTQNASAHNILLPAYGSGSATIQGNCYWNSAGTPTFRVGSTTYTGLPAFRAINYERLGSTDVGQVADPQVALTFGSYRLARFVPQSATIRAFEPPILPGLDYDLLRLYDVGGFRVFEPQLGPFAMGLNLGNISAGGGGGEADWTTTERSQIRHRLGLDGATNTPTATPNLGNQTLADGAITAAKIADGAITEPKIATGAFTAAKFAAGAFDAVWTAATRTLTSIADSAGVTTLLARLTSGRAGNLDNLDATISSRLAGASYTAPPTATSNAAAVRTELATELGRIDAPISSRSTYSGADTTGTTTLLGRLTSDRAGYLDKLNVSGTLAHTDNASTFRADVSALLTSSAYTSSLPPNFGALAITQGGAVTTSNPGGGATAAQIWEYSGGDRSLTGAQATNITAIAAHTTPLAAQLGLLPGISATHSPNGITVSAGPGSTVITDNADGSYTVESAP
jgi:hypothetical protein